MGFVVGFVLGFVLHFGICFHFLEFFDIYTLASMSLLALFLSVVVHDLATSPGPK